MLWSWMKPNGVFEPSDDSRIDAFGDAGKVLFPVQELVGEDYDDFKQRIADYSLGFREITSDPFLPRLSSLAEKFGRLYGDPRRPLLLARNPERAGRAIFEPKTSADCLRSSSRR